MKALLEAIQAKLMTINDIRHVDEDWGQLDTYSPNPPTTFPLALIDIGGLVYQNLGRDNNVVPIQRQTAEGTIVITIANAKLTNTSGRAPQSHKDKAWKIHDIIEKVHCALHGQRLVENVGAMIRISNRRVRRDDGIQEYEITYTIGASNV